MDFLRREDGAVALIFGLMAIPFMALVGWAVDYVRLNHVRDYLQAQVDIAAINALLPDEQWELNANRPDQPWRLAIEGEIQREYQGDWARNVTVNGSWLVSGSDFRVTAVADVPLAFINLLPGIGDTQAVAVSAVSRLITPTEKRGAPESTFLDSEAGDFNRLWMYCYWPDRPEGDPDRPRRTQMVPIADNGGSVFDVDLGVEGEAVINDRPIDSDLGLEFDHVIDNYEHGLDGREEGLWRVVSGAGTNSRKYVYYMPNCTGNSRLSFRLENVRFARGLPQYWDSGTAPSPGGDGHTGRFNYYTDTTFSAEGVEEYDGLVHPYTNQPVRIVETVLCDSIEECTTVSKGGIVPEGKNRTPLQASGQCVSTADQRKYMYYGWEDRPPGQTGASGGWEDFAWTDGDYDDITVVIECPYFEVDGERLPRLIG